MNRVRWALTLGVLLLLGGGAGWADLNEAGKAAYGRGDFVEAERLFREAIAAAPDEPTLYYHHGVALSRLKRWSEAAGAFEKALRLNPPAIIASAAREGLRAVEPMTRPQPRTRDEGLPAPARSQPRPPAVELPSDTVRMRRAWGNWYVDVVINDMQHATFLVDTGATACAITPALAEAVGIRPDPDLSPVLVRGVAGTTYGHVVTIPTIRVGEVEAQNVRALIMNLDGLQGILGNTFLSRYTTTVDPARGVLTLRPR